MRTYELSLTSNYVADWTFEMAIRELIQNGIDQEAVDPYDKFTIEYTDGKLLFSNPKSYLKVNTLLLGRSSKQHDEKTVGQFGEGYKIASLVLNRLGKTFTVHNRNKFQIWTSRFVNSRRWHDRILVFDVADKDYEDRGLTIEIGNVTQEEYDALQSTWLGFQKEYDHIDTTYGQILTDAVHKNHIYVNGLYISCNAEMEYGYNFNPEYLQLERDRKSCDSWDARWLTSRMIAEAYNNGDMDGADLFDLVENSSDDVSNVGYWSNDAMSMEYLERFDTENARDGEKPIPVQSQSEYDAITAKGGYAVFVSSNIHRILENEKEKRIEELNAHQPEMSLHDKFHVWFELYRCSLSTKACDEFSELLNELC